MSRSLARALVLFAGLICIATAHAQSYTYSVYIDTDNNSATGCTVNSPGGALPGIESILAISVTAGTSPTVNSVTRSRCSGGVMGAPVAEGNGAVSVGAGIGGTTSVEISDALINLAPPSATALRLYVAAQSALGSDVLLTTTGAASGSSIVLPLQPGGGTTTPTPMIGIPAALLLVALLLALGSRAARKRMIKPMMLGLVLLSGVASAAIFNWSGFSPLATDPAGDSTSGESAIDLRYFFAASATGNAYFRMDVTGNLASTLPTVTSVSPSAGPPVGGTSVTITGANFAGTTAMTFGAAAATFTVNSATTITATAPAGSAGTVDVTVTTPSGTSATNAADQYTYVAVPTVTAVSPSTGPVAGGTSVTITGANFTGATAVMFGTTATSSFTVNSATNITAIAPAGSGTVDVTVTTAGGTSATSAADQYTYVAVPTVTAVSPNSGLTTGGTVVTITGANFAGATAVNFAATAASAFTVNNAATITATAPAGSAGTVDITVTTAGGTSATGGSDKFSYVVPTPTVFLTVAGDSIHLNGTTAASTVNLIGADLTAYPAATFGTVAKLVAAGTTSVVDSSGNFTLDASGNGSDTMFDFGTGAVSGSDAASSAGITYIGVTTYITSTKHDTVTLSAPAQNVTASGDGETVNLGSLTYTGTLNFTAGTGGIDTINATVGGDISGSTINGTSSSVAKIDLVMSSAGTETVSTEQYNTITSTTGGSITFTGGTAASNTIAFSDQGTVTDNANIGGYQLNAAIHSTTNDIYTFTVANNGADNIAEYSTSTGGSTYNLNVSTFTGSLALGSSGNDSIVVPAGNDISQGTITSAGTTASLSATGSGAIMVSSGEQNLFHNAPAAVATSGAITMAVADNANAINLNAQENAVANVATQANNNTVNISVGAASVNSGAAGFNQTVVENGAGGGNAFKIDNGAATIVGTSDAVHYVAINNFNTTSDNINLTLSGNAQNNGEQNISDSGNDTITVGVNSVIVEEDLGALPGFTVFNATDLPSAQANMLRAINASASTSGEYTFVIDSNQGAAIYEIHINSGAGTIDGIQLICVVHGVGAFNLINHVF
jgi:hypothetical protein